MSEPDYDSLALRLGDAANLLEQFGSLVGYPSPEQVRWSPNELRREAEELTS